MTTVTNGSKFWDIKNTGQNQNAINILLEQIVPKSYSHSAKQLMTKK